MTATSRVIRGVLVGLALVVASSTRSGAEEPATADSQQRKDRLESMKRQAAEYTLTLAAEVSSSKPTKLTLHDEPLLRFSNPVGGVPDGIVVMWKHGARPAVFAQV